MFCSLCKQEVTEETWEQHIYSKKHQEEIDKAVRREDGEEKHGFILTSKGITRF